MTATTDDTLPVTPRTIRDEMIAFGVMTVLLAIDVGILIGGVVVIETVFAYPGLGRLLVFLIEQHDLPLLQAGMMVVTAIYALANLVADVLYAVVDPRIRLGGSAA